MADLMNAVTANFANLRGAASLTQAQAAKQLGVSQPFLSMIEKGKKKVSKALFGRMQAVYVLSANYLPLEVPEPSRPAFFQEELGGLGYPGFAYLDANAHTNPAALLLSALNQENLDQRVVEGLSWLPLHFSTMSWEWLVPQAKLRDRQNRLGFIVALSAQMAGLQGQLAVQERLNGVTASLEKSRLAKMDTLCYEAMNRAQRAAVERKRTPLAEQWNLLTDLNAEWLVHVIQ
jgi:transcriptional regulator with XRE-family HTH domain